MFFRKRRRIYPQINVTSLIDVVLNLLIFFMLSSTFVTQQGIRIDLPEAKATTKNVSREENTIIITAENAIYINGQEIGNIEDLRQQLLTVKNEQQGDLIIVKADEKVAHGIVVSVMDIARISGFTRIAIATR